MMQESDRDSEVFEKASEKEASKRERALTPEAKRALEEAERRHASAVSAAPIEEIGGRGGLEPTRYGDWERKGIASDF